ncbi:Leucine-rich repeat receptor-like protein kinase TDR, partial [Clarias magur]
MQQRTINAAAVCMSTSVCAAVNLRAAQRDSFFLYSGASARGHVEERSLWAAAAGSRRGQSELLADRLR